METLIEPHSVSVTRSAGRIRLVVEPTLDHTPAVDAISGLRDADSPVDKLRWRRSTTEFVLHEGVDTAEEGIFEAVRLAEVLHKLGIPAEIMFDTQL